MLRGCGVPQGPAGDEQAGCGHRFGVAEGGERGTSHPLAGLAGMGDECAGEVWGQAFAEPLEGQQAKVAAGHVDNARNAFALRQGGVVVRLRVVAGGEEDARCRVGGW